MSKPNINIPTEFAINGDKTDFSQAKITNGFDRLQPDVLPGDNLNKFIDDTYKGVTSVNIFSFFNSNELFNLIERIKKVEVEESFINGYASITKESLSNKHKYSAAIIYNQYAIILIEGDFSQVQLNKISNLLK